MRLGPISIDKHERFVLYYVANTSNAYVIFRDCCAAKSDGSNAVKCGLAEARETPCRFWSYLFIEGL